MAQTPGPGEVVCVRCGHVNRAWRTRCERCKSRLSQSGGVMRSAAGQSAQQEGILCFHCGGFNPTDHVFCSQCGKRLRFDETHERPGCVTLYAVLIVLGNVLLLFILLSASAYFRSYREIGMPLLLISAGLSIASAVGIWQMKNWGRMLILLSCGIGLVSSLISLNVIAMVLDAIVAYWFWQNGDKFT